MTEKLIADWLLDNGSMERAIDGLNIDPAIFKDNIQKWLDECYSDGLTFENENEATEYWLEDDGYELIQKAIEAWMVLGRVRFPPTLSGIT